MPTSLKAKKSLVQALPDQLSIGKIYELGSGWGTLAFPLAHHYAEMHVIGYETSPIPYWASKIWAVFARTKNLSLLRRDFFLEPLNDASLVVCYLYPEAMRRLKTKFEKELKPGTWIVTNTFAIAGWKPEKIYEIPDLYRTRIYVYKIPDSYFN